MPDHQPIEKKIDLEFLEALRRRHHKVENLYPDPLFFARGFEDPLEGETAGIIAAALAYGRVEKIVEALGFIFSKLGKHPRRTLLALGPKDLQTLFEGFYYRFNKGEDLAIFLWLLKNTLERQGSLKSVFSNAYGGGYREALTSLTCEVMESDPRPLWASPRLPRQHPARYLMTSPATGSAAKRLCLFMRWMVRRDKLDPGYWHGELPESRLIVPLDTHVAKVGRAFGMTARKSADWKTAVEITNSLAHFYPNDPLCCDFTLFRYGMNRIGIDK